MMNAAAKRSSQWMRRRLKPGCRVRSRAAARRLDPDGASFVGTRTHYNKFREKYKSENG